MECKQWCVYVKQNFRVGGAVETCWTDTEDIERRFREKVVTNFTKLNVFADNVNKMYLRDSILYMYYHILSWNVAATCSYFCFQ